MPPERTSALIVTDDSFAALVRMFMLSAKWTSPPPQGYTESTKETWGRELDALARPAFLGAYKRSEIRPSLVQKFMDAISDWPGKQKAGMGALVQLEKWAIVRDLLPRQITLGVEIGKSSGGHIPWAADLVTLAELNAKPILARAVTLAANTGQRGSDLVRMGPTSVEEYEGIRGINVVQMKTKRRVWIPITDELAAAMEGWDRDLGPYLRRNDGAPWSRKALTNAWSYERDTNPALAPLRLENLKLEDGVNPGQDGGLVLHGLRGFSCVRLHRAGLTAEQIGDVVGMSPEVVKTYIRFAVQKDNAIAAMQKVDRTFTERLSKKLSQVSGQ